MDRQTGVSTMKGVRTRGPRGNGKRSDPDRPDPAIPSADNAAGTQESARRNRADADVRRGHAVLRHHPGGTAHGVSRSRIVQTSSARGCAWNADEPAGHAGAWPPAGRIANGLPSDLEPVRVRKVRQANG